jgi:hypothetical protein
VNGIGGSSRPDDFGDGFALLHIGEVPVKAAPCPLSVQEGEKLMQKIHRLTDN